MSSSPIDTLMRVRNWDANYENNRTRSLKQLNWVPIPNSLDGDGYTELVDHPNGAAHLGAWLAIVQIASRCEVRGTLTRKNRQPHTAETLARISRIPVATFEEALPRLLSIGWLEATAGDAPIPQEGAGIRQDVALKGKKEGSEVK